MPADKTRISHDPRQQYRDVVWQQGRVLSDADWNEAWLIEGEASREEILDIVGPAGTPDDGYKIGPPPPVIPPMTPVPPPYDFTIGAGTMYVGGLRLYLPEPIPYSLQPEWRDHDDPPWVDPNELPIANEFIVLTVHDQEVSAVEDDALREVALGGPDTAARTRLVQRVVRHSVEARDCEGALAELRERWLGQGLAFDETAMRLASSGLLQATWAQGPSEPDPCEPEAQGGYLGADNQLIRVQIVDYNPVDDTGQLLWGYDNASFLHRVTAITNLTVDLDTAPVDLEHEPDKPPDRVVELLRTAVETANGSYIAAASGHVSGVAGYDRDKRRLGLSVAMPTGYSDTTPTPQLYLRLWNQLLDFSLNTDVALGDTGLQVRITARPVPGDFWQIAVRPETPTEVYPERFATPQPPDGPGRWICPLAVISWPEGQFRVLEDCREHFDNLVELTRRRGGCCTVTLRPGDVRGRRRLQDFIDRLAHPVPVGTDRNGHAHPVIERPTICLLPGEYTLDAPLRLGPENSNLTIEGCHDGVILRAADGADDEFQDGLIQIIGAEGVTIKGLRFVLPMPPPREDGPGQFLGAALQTMRYSIGIRTMACARLTVADCLFRYRLAPERRLMERRLIAIGIFLSGECWGLALHDNRFLHDGTHLTVADFEQGQILIGVLLTPVVVVEEVPDDSDDVGTIVCRTARSLLHDATIRGNLFSGMSVALTGYAILGTVRLRDNTVRNCYFGVGLVDLRSPSAAAFGFQIAVAIVLAMAGFDVGAFVGQLPELWLRFLFLLSGGVPFPAIVPERGLTETSCDIQFSSLPSFVPVMLGGPGLGFGFDDDDPRWTALPPALRRHAAAFLWLIDREMTCAISPQGFLFPPEVDPLQVKSNRLRGRVFVESNDMDVSVVKGQATMAMFLWSDECDPQFQLTATSNSFRNGPWWSRQLPPVEPVQPPIG